VLLRHVVSQKFTDVSDVLAAAIVRGMSEPQVRKGLKYGKQSLVRGLLIALMMEAAALLKRR
jgi:hypothetical protein